MSGGRRWRALGWALLATVALGHGWALGAWATSPRLPQWDMAKYGVSGLRLAAAAETLDPLGFARELSALSVWPPTYPLIEAAAFLSAGRGYGVPRGLMAALFGLAVLATGWAMSRVSGDRWLGAAAGFLAAAWWAGGPFFQAFATLNMLEVPGVLLLALALGSYLRALDGGSHWAWRGTWIASAALFFCKYNYGLLWLVPLGIAECLRVYGSWRGLGSGLVEWGRPIRWRRPFPLFLLASLGLLAAVRLTGGFDTEVLGVRLRMTSVGNPAYVLGWILVLRWWLRGGAARRVDLSRLRAFDVQTGGAVAWLAAPIAFWMAIPPHVKDFFGFVENRDSALSFVEALTLYPKALLEVYAPQPLLGVAVGVLGLVHLRWLVGEDPKRRVLALALAFSLAALALHPYKLPRFAFTAFWLLGCCAAVSAVDLWSRLSQSSPWGRRWGAVAVGVLGTVALAVVLGTGVHHGAVAAEHERRTASAEVLPVLDRIADFAAACGVSTDRPLVVLGTWNLFSPSLVEWHLRSRQGGLGAGRLGAGRVLVDVQRSRRMRGRSDALIRLLDGPEGACVAVVERLGRNPEHQWETQWQHPAALWLETSSRHVPVPIPGDGAGAIKASGHRLRLYRGSSDPASSSGVS
ncbi:MAG: hypothetical protein AAGN66_24780 [Acidobacteriota bacterium]